MDKVGLVHKRKKRYMGQILGSFDALVLPHVPEEVAEEFKGLVRQKLNAMALDANEIHSMKPGEEMNGAAVELRDQIDADGRIPRRVTA